MYRDRLFKILTALKQTLSLGSYDRVDAFRYAASCAKQGDYRTALRYFDRAERWGYSDTFRLYTAKAICLFRLDKPKEAMEYAKRISEHEPDNCYIGEVRNECRKYVFPLFGDRKLKEAYSIVQSALEIWPSDSTLLAVMANLEMTHRHDPESSKHYLQEAHRCSDEESGFVYQIEGALLYDHLNKRQEGLACLEKTVSLNKSKFNLISLGYRLIDVDIERAKSIYEGLYAQEPEDTEVIYGLAEITMKEGNIDRGLEIARKGLLLMTDNDNLNALVGFAYYQLEQYKKSLRHYRKALKLDYGDQAYICSAIADCYYELGSLRKAHKWAEKALEINPEYTEATALLSKIGTH